MNETRKTVIFVVVAAALAVAAVLAVPARRMPDLFSDEGTPFYEPFDPLEVGAVTVASFPEDALSPRVFKVEFKDGMWTIPSHQNYPADAKDQLAKTAAVVNGLVRGSVRSDRERDFALYGVADPLDDTRASAAGRGRRVTLQDRTGRLLTDLVIGKEVEGQRGHYYVRRPDSNRIYSCEIDARGISTRFADWVDTDLLRLRAGDVRRIVLDKYRVNHREGVLVRGDVLDLSRKDSAADWQMGGLGEREEVAADKVRRMTSTLADLTLVGVRRKPSGLQDLLDRIRKGGGVSRSDMHKLGGLTRVGFHLVRDGEGYRVVSNEGELRVAASNGVTYSLLFGEVLFGEPDRISAAPEEAEREPPAEGEGDGDGGEPEDDDPVGGAEHRYLFVTAEFDEGLLGPRPEAPARPAEGAEEDEEAKEEYDRARRRYEERLAEYEEKVEEGRKKARELRDRFADWYYVISADAYARLNLSRDDLVQEKEPEEEPDPEEESTPAPEEAPVPDEEGAEEGEEAAEEE